MFGQLAVGGVQFRLIPAWMLDAGLGVVWDGHLRHSAQELQSADMRADPAGKVLAACRFREGVTAGAQHGYEQRSLKIHLARPGIVNGDLVAGIIDEQFLSGAIFLPQNHIQLARPVTIQFAEVTVTIAVVMTFAIFFPNQLQCQVTMGLQLPADGGEIGCLGFAPSRRRARRAGHNFFQTPLISKRHLIRC